MSPSHKLKHHVVVSIAVQAVLEVESEFNEQGVYCTVAWPQGGTSPLLFSAVPIGPPVRPEEAAALGRAAMTDVAQKLLARISESDTKVEPAAVLMPSKGEVN